MGAGARDGSRREPRREFLRLVGRAIGRHSTFKGSFSARGLGNLSAVWRGGPSGAPPLLGGKASGPTNIGKTNGRQRPKSNKDLYKPRLTKSNNNAYLQTQSDGASNLMTSRFSFGFVFVFSTVCVFGFESLWLCCLTASASLEAQRRGCGAERRPRLVRARFRIHRSLSKSPLLRQCKTDGTKKGAAMSYKPPPLGV